MDSKLARWCDGLIEAGWLAAIIAIPLFFNIHSERVFEPDKLTLLRSIAVLMAAAWLVKFVEQQGWRDLGWLQAKNREAIWHKPFVLPIFVLVCVYLISTIFSVTPRVSWAGSYQRLQGTYTTLSYITIFALVAATMRTREQVRRVVTTIIITSIPIAFYGLLQHFDLDPLPWGGNVTRRVAGHMGNSIFIAAYLIMAVPLTLGRIIDAFTNILGDDELSNADVVRSSVYIFALAIQMITIYWSGSRGPLLGLAAGLFAFTLVLLVSLRNAVAEGKFRLADATPALIFLLPSLLVLLLSNVVAQATTPLTAFAVFMGVVALSVLAIFVLVAARRGWKWLWLGWILLTLFMGVWLVLFNIPDASTQGLRQAPVIGGMFESLSAWRELPTIGSYGKMLDPTQNVGREKSNRVRVLIWQGVVQLISPHAPLQYPDGSTDPFNFLRPFIGYGPESMYVAYNRFYPPELATVEARNASPDRSHNETFDALVITGIVGFVVWQALYLSVFYYAFRYLGVVDSRRDRNVLFAAWIGGGVLAGLLAALLADPIYLGVAIPSGTIMGLVLYLIYYALLAQAETAVSDNPFQVDRLLVNGLVAAVLAHFVEIHFGIAIAATRLHFFLFVGLIFMVAYKLRGEETETAVSPEPTPDDKPTRGRRRVRVATAAPAAGSGWGAPVWVAALTLAFILGILAFEYMSYALPPDKIIQSRADLTAGEIFYQSLFINARRGFVDSPFIFLMMMFTWLLGGLVALSEMVKHGEWVPPLTAVSPVPPDRRTMLGVGFMLVGAASIGYRFIVPLTDLVSTTALLGRSLTLIWGALCFLAALRLFTNGKRARLLAGAVALIGLLTALPVMVAGGTGYGLLTAVACAILLYLLWEHNWNNIVWPPAIVGVVSLSIGLLVGYLQANNLRGSLLLQSPTPLETLDQIMAFRVFEAERAAGFLTFFYTFMVLMLLGTAVSLTIPWLGRRLRQSGTALGFGGLALLLIGALLFNAITNVRVVQADMVYKRARPFDNQGGSEGNSDAWNVAIAIYERALEMVPKEDFYYLFLGRAYLENSTVTADPAAREVLLADAETRLLQAQAINPLNTDHTANLARLNTRWYQLDSNAATQPLRLERARDYYQTALMLSPQNSIVRNEYAFLALELDKDCDEALAIYQQSAEIDPFYASTYFSLADTYVSCAPDSGEERTTAYQSAADALELGLARDGSNPRAWAQAGQIYQQIGRPTDAVAAYEEAMNRDRKGELPAWNMNYLLATAYAETGDKIQARELGELARSLAPEAVLPEIEQFLASIGN